MSKIRHRPLDKERAAALGDLLRKGRIAQGLSVVALSKATGLTRATIQNLEDGIACPTAETMEKLSGALGLDLSAYLPLPPKGGDHA